MTPKLSCFFLLLLLPFVLPAQGPYAGAGFGYGFPVAGSVIGVDRERDTPADTYSYESVKGSFATGMNFGGYFGYMVNAHMGFEAGANYLLGKQYTFTYHQLYSPDIDERATDDVSARSLRLTVATRIVFGEGKFRPYLRGGLAFGVLNKITDESKNTALYFGTTTVTEETYEMTGGVSAGFAGALGMNYSLSDKLFLSAEITNYYASWGPRYGKLTRSVQNGTDQLPGMTVSEKEFEFVDKTDQTMNTSDSSPTKSLRTFFPMSSFGLTIGIHYSFHH
jgi:hypothetical protein